MIFLTIFYSPMLLARSTCFNIKGIQSNEIADNIFAKLDVSRKQPCVDRVNFNINEVNKQIKSAIQPFGYFKSKIHTNLNHTKYVTYINLLISLGEPLLIKQIKIKITGAGAENIAINKFVKNFPISPYSIFNAAVYQEAKKTLFNIAINEGYIDAYFKNRVLIDIKKYEANIFINLNTQNQYFFDNFIVDKGVYKDNFINQIIRQNINKHHHFSNEVLLTLQQKMEQSAYFERVSILPDFTHKKNYRIPIHIQYTVPKKYQYQLGIGYGSLTGFRFINNINWQRINNTGQHFSSDLVFSSLLLQLETKYFIPGKNPLTDNWIINANIKKFEPKAGKSQSFTVGVGYSTELNNYKFEAKLNNLVERFRLWGSRPQTAYILYPSLLFGYLRLNDLIYPTQGFSINFNLRGSITPLLTASDFIQPELKTKFLFSLFNQSKIIARGNIGYTAVKNLNKFPLSLRYFAGGVNSIRGFSDMSIGPGKYLLIGSIEYQYPILNKFNAAFFYDLGSASNHLPGTLNKGVGVGLIYESILGPIKIYVAQAISKKSRPYSIEFVVGPEFS